VGKWLSALKEISPAIARVVLMVNPDTAPPRGIFYVRAFESAAATFSVEPITTFVHNATEIEAAVAALARQLNGSLIVAPEAFTRNNRQLSINYHLNGTNRGVRSSPMRFFHHR
jgi:ABC-type uncharacterized transport system substrate-binding protein